MRQHGYRWFLLILVLYHNAQKGFTGVYIAHWLCNMIDNVPPNERLTFECFLIYACIHHPYCKHFPAWSFN